MQEKKIEIRNISKSYGDVKVIDNLSFDVYNGEIICIVGTSGCGKTTLLNILAGLLDLTDGEIKYNFNKNNIGYMMQEPALLEWLNVKKNAQLGCILKKIKFDTNEIDNLINKYGLSKFKNNYPKELSGGMKQRVSLIRTIATKPEILLLDEPFAALDYQSRLLISNDIYNATKENNITTIMITHDISEAISLADRIIVLSNRPSKIKRIYDINLKSKSTPSLNRKDEYFMKYYEAIGKDLDLFEKE